MEYCETCSNLVVVEGRESGVVWNCTSCNVETPIPPGTLLYKKSDKAVSVDIHKLIANARLDHTLPVHTDIICPAATHPAGSEVIRVCLNEKTLAMAYLCKVCDFKWTN